MIVTKKKQKTSSHGEHDLKKTSINRKMTSNDLKKTWNESFKYRKKKVKGGITSDNPTQGSILTEQSFSSPING